MNIWKKRLRQLAIAAGLIGGVTGAAYAAQFAPRQFNTQQTHYLRFEVDFNSCVPVSSVCSVKVGAVPYNSWLLRAHWQIITVFNSGTIDQLGLSTFAGTSNSDVKLDIVGRSNVHTGVAQTVSTLTLATGTAAVGAGVTQSGSDGGFEIYAVYNSTSTAPTTGKAVFVLEYAAPNDGSCTTVPMGATAVAC